MKKSRVTESDLDLHMNLLVHHVSPVSTNMTESLYDKVKREWVHDFQSLSLEGESSTELVAVATEPLTSASQLPMGWALHKRGASARLPKNVRQYLTLKFNIGRDTDRRLDLEQVAKDMRECSMEQSGYPTYRFRVSSRDCALNGDLKYNKNRMIPQTQTTKTTT